MNSLYDIIAEIPEVIYKYRKQPLDNKSIVRYTIPFNAFNYNNDTRILGLYQTKIELFYQSNDIKILININYQIKKIVIYEIVFMPREIVINIPYGSRSNYLKAMYELNVLVGEDGTLALLVDNNPYNLESCVFLEIVDRKNVDAIMKIISHNKLEIIKGIGFNEIIQDFGNRKHDIRILPFDVSFEDFSHMFMAMFSFVEKKKLVELGYHFKRTEKKKLFISYAHKDKKTIYDIIEHLDESGVNYWLDKQMIDVGDKILESISNGMNDSDLPIIFLSKNTLEANYAKHELSTFFSQVIQGSKKWFIVRLDNVDPNEIYMGLGDYLYYDYPTEGIDSLVEKIKSKLEKIK